MSALKIVRKGDKLQYYDASDKLRIEETLEYKKWYHTDGTTVLRHDTATGTIIYNTSGTKLAEFSSSECGVYSDASNYLKFIPTGLTLAVSASSRFSFGHTGVCVGTNGTRSYTLDPSSLTSNASFQSTDVCPNLTMEALRSTPA